MLETRRAASAPFLPLFLNSYMSFHRRGEDKIDTNTRLVDIISKFMEYSKK